MRMPVGQEYQEAIQHPATCFADADLRAAQPVLTPLGLPKPVSGGFATVFPVKSGARTYAVRCFTTYHPDQEQRYQAISQHLQRNPLPYLVDFAFLRQGIRLKGAWLPIVKMEWVDGESLHAYIERNLQPQPLARLAEQFRTLVMDLRQAGIAHGDLQHGNILLAGGALRIIDYDGMYVPALGRATSHETGHRNYQHPGRTERDFGPDVDNFSAWVIYLSLMALSRRPQLWQELRGGDEHLLLRREDFERPRDSKVLAALQALGDPVVADLLGRFRMALSCSPLAVPPLPQPAAPAAKPRSVRSTPAKRANAVPLAAAQPVSTARTNGLLPDWLADLLPPPPPAPAPTTGDSSWLADYLPAAAQLAARAKSPKVVAGAGVAGGVGLAALPVLAGAGPVTTGLALLMTVLTGVALALCFVWLAQDQERLVLQTRLLQVRWRARWVGRRYLRLVVARQQLITREQDEVGRALQNQQQRFLEQRMRSLSVTSAGIPGIGDALTTRLRQIGVASAHDVEPRRIATVEGFGGARTASLLAWRQRCEDDARAAMPASLEPALAASIDARIGVHRRAAEAALQAADSTLSALRREEADLLRRLAACTSVPLRDFLRQMLPG